MTNVQHEVVPHAATWGTGVMDLFFDLAKILILKAGWQAAGRDKTKSEKTCMAVPRGQEEVNKLKE